MIKLLLIPIIVSLSACQPVDSIDNTMAYKASCTNGTDSMIFDVDGVDYDGNLMSREESVQMLADALTDDTEYQGVWTCE